MWCDLGMVGLMHILCFEVQEIADHRATLRFYTLDENARTTCAMKPIVVEEGSNYFGGVTVEKVLWDGPSDEVRAKLLGMEL